MTSKNVDLCSVGWMETTSLTLCSVACSSGERTPAAAARFYSIGNLGILLSYYSRSKESPQCTGCTRSFRVEVKGLVSAA